ncbi:MAG: SO_0444 family Cu/Zn efflux transporter [Bacteriovoracaceae bacterium]|nr:SO_0444 family Cu/Zn efflux transporter [Bacteriovoracaceae bacterium]
MEFLLALWKYIAISAPYLLLGFFIAGLIKILVPIEKVKIMLGKKNLGSIFKAAIIGVPLPLCSCSVVPTAITLKKAGANNGATSAFLIATPESGIDSISMTYGMMDLPMTIIRPVAAFLSAVVAGIGQYLFNDKEYDTSNAAAPKSCCSKKVPEKEEVKSCCSSKKSVKKQDMFLIKTIKYAYGDLIQDVAFWMTIGLILGAIIDFLIPADFLTMANGTMGRLIILGIGIPFYICASASTPIAASLMLKGLSPGAALLFLLVGPATNITNLLVLQKYIGKRGVFINILSIGGVALLLSYVVDFLYTFYQWPLDFKLGHSHDHGLIPWWQHVSAVIFSLMLLRGLIVEEVIPRIKGEKKNNGK